MRKRTGLGESAAMAAWILAERGANSSSTMATPSSPALTAMLPPAPCSMEMGPATLTVLISTLAKRSSSAAEAAVAMQTARMSRGSLLMAAQATEQAHD